ncbi:hypothetical protein B5X24_HaOG214604 [Helicoverpa armigera]|uniref:V(D)J recombination-activating protein 1 RNase H domain-containing protein n=1 Tax=Helicoverpa armigera TaxID=29058 RepID=A0A2W1BGX1_HELAM|nr:hypothetical protein B5X24_HaOG214604 [Helicoverpa armigera]
MSTFSISYKELVEILLLSNREVHKCLENLKSKYPNLVDDDLEKVYRELSQHFIPAFSKKWKKCARNKTSFFAKNEEWLKLLFNLPVSTAVESSEECEPGPSKRTRTGRPEKSFDECCDRAKRYKVKSLCENNEQQTITNAAKCLEGELKPKKFSPEQALALFLDASLSKHQYEIIKKATKDLGCDIFPCYDIVSKAKKMCLAEDIECTESYAVVGLQSLLDHTVKRIFMTKTKEELSEMNDTCTLDSKWGCDGSSGHSEYKQAFDEEDISDENLFLTSLVPLRLTDAKNDTNVHWFNNSPSSTRLCRPVQFQFTKETREIIKNEISRMEGEIKNLNESIVNVDGKIYKVKHNLMFTMIDGKVAQTVTDTASNAVCFICKAKPTEMNDLNHVRTKVVDEDALKVGLSPLHARIKFMECILHIAYNKSFQMWRVNKNTSHLRDEEKKRIQGLFAKVGLKVDCVKQGSGTTNDGNMARRFFADARKISEITGVDFDLIYRFSIILQVINSGACIDAVKFGEYCEDTAERYLSLYSWYYMPNTIHKVLIHGSKIISAAMLPIGMLSEEAQEARNKDYRQYRLHHARKCSRESTNEDVINMLLISSDPLLYTMRKRPIKKNLPLDEDAKNLLSY